MDKAWFESKTVWGALIAAAGPILGLVGITPEIIDAGITLVGALFALYGRFKAEGGLTLT